MNKKEKILFSYTTHYKEGMPSQKPYLPEPLLINISANEAQTIIVTAGCYLLSFKDSYINVDIWKDDVMVSQDSDTLDGYQELISNDSMGGGAFVIVTAMHVQNIIFSSSGEYEIRIRLVEVNSNGEKRQADSFSCFLTVVVSKED